MFSTRSTFLGAAVALAALVTSAVPAYATGAFGVSEANFEAGTCVNTSCTYASVEKDHAEAFTQAAGHPPWGITTFTLNNNGEKPEGTPLKRVRVDVPPGLAADPQALHQCPRSVFEEGKCLEDTKVGTTEMTVFVEVLGVGKDLETTGNVFNLPPSAGLPLDFGIEIAQLAPIVEPVRIYLEGHVAWWSDYHEYFEINNIPREVGVLGGVKSPLETIKSKLNFDGHAGPAGAQSGNFLTLPSVCSPTTESHLEVESWSGEISRTQTHTPVGVGGCGGEVPFKPSVSVIPEDAASDEVDGATVLLSVPQNVQPGEINTADIKDAHVVLPEGLTLDPSAARGLQTCSPAQIGIGTTNPVECPPASRVGTATIETDLPPHSLSGGVYLGDPGGGPITGPPYTIYIDAESVYDISVRLAGTVTSNPSTGRLEATFDENPQLPFSELIFTVKGGAQAPLANPLSCATQQVEWAFTPYTQEVAVALGASPFASAGCSSPLPFSWTQSTADSPARAGAFGETSYTFNLARGDGQQYLGAVGTTLPAGLVGAIGSVPLCGEPQAAQGSCPAASQIGSASVLVGAGPEPLAFSGPVYLTGAYDGAPFGLSIPILALAGPFDFGTVVTRAAINVNPYDARVVVTSSPPTIVAGVPLRLRSVSVTVNRHDFLYNPTSCAALATETTLTSTLGATQPLSSPFSVSDCGALAFTPSFSASTVNNATKANGAGLKVTVTQPPHQANIASVITSLPLQLPSRLTTLQQACPEKTYTANPRSCPTGSNVGSATVATPTLPGVLSGPAYLVSHGGAAFPDLDVLLEGSGVRVILTGNTDIKGGVTTSTFKTLPDVPISSFTLTLPTGPHSALAAYGSFCAKPLLMPTTITAQSGAQIKQDTHIAVAGCKPTTRLFRVLSIKRTGHGLLVKVKALAAGRLSVSGPLLKTVARTLRKPATVKLFVPLTPRTLSALRRHRSLMVAVRITLKPSKRGERSASALAHVALRRSRPRGQPAGRR